MTLSLHTIHPAKNSKKKKKIIGRGGKHGTYSGKGLKGQKARSGTSGFKRRGMKGLIEATPKLRGFKSHKPKFEVVNLKDLNKYKDGDKINPKILKKTGLVDKIENGVKILGKGEINVKINVEECKVSDSAKEKIEKAGGKIINKEIKDVKGNR